MMETEGEENVNVGSVFLDFTGSFKNESKKRPAFVEKRLQAWKGKKESSIVQVVNKENVEDYNIRMAEMKKELDALNFPVEATAYLQ